MQSGLTSRSSARLLTDALGVEVQPVSIAANAKNSHFRTSAPGGSGGLFIKLIQGKRRYFDAELAADRFLAEHDLPRAAIRHSGLIGSDCYWIAYDWIDLRPFEPTVDGLRQLACTLGAMHRFGVGWNDPLLRSFGSPPDMTWASFTAVRSFNAALADRLQRLFEPCLQRWPSDQPMETCLLHGDFGFRNVGLTRAADVLLVDYEHASIGLPIMEFAKAWDRELSDPAVAADFLALYGKVAEVETREWQRTSPMVRLWAAANIFPYAAQYDDRPFEEHGLEVISKLEREVGLA